MLCHTWCAKYTYVFVYEIQGRDTDQIYLQRGIGSKEMRKHFYRSFRTSRSSEDITLNHCCSDIMLGSLHGPVRLFDPHFSLGRVPMYLYVCDCVFVRPHRRRQVSSIRYSPKNSVLLTINDQLRWQKLFVSGRLLCFFFFCFISNYFYHSPSCVLDDNFVSYVIFSLCSLSLCFFFGTPLRCFIWFIITSLVLIHVFLFQPNETKVVAEKTNQCGIGLVLLDVLFRRYCFAFEGFSQVKVKMIVPHTNPSIHSFFSIRFCLHRSIRCI